MTPRLSRYHVRTAGAFILRALLISTLLASAIAPTLAPTSAHSGVTATVNSTGNASSPAPTSAASPSTTENTTQIPPGDYHPMCQHYGENGFSVENPAMLFSRDNDQLQGDGWTRADYVENCGHDPTWATNYTLEFDYTRHQAFPQVPKWNQRDIRDIPTPTPARDVAVHPEGVPTVSAGAIKAASASVYAVSPSVALRDERRGGTTLLIRDETTIQGAQSYRIHLDGAIDDDEGPKLVEYRVTNHRVVGTCLLEGGLSFAAGVRKQQQRTTLCHTNDPLASSGDIPSSGGSGQTRGPTSQLTFEY